MSSHLPPPSGTPQDPFASKPAKPVALFRQIVMLGPSTLADTLHSGRHSRDFTLARNDYLRSSVLVTGILFLLLTPLWLLVDYWLLPRAALTHVVPGRLFLM